MTGFSDNGNLNSVVILLIAFPPTACPDAVCGPIELSGYPLKAFPYGIPFPPIINLSSNGIKL